MGFARRTRYAQSQSRVRCARASIHTRAMEAIAVDGQHFDALTLALARGFPRRAALGSLVGAVLTGATFRHQPVSAGNKRKDKDDCEHFEGHCNDRGDCCTKKGLVCISRVCLNCVAHHGSCNPNARWGDECCNGFSCDSGDLICVKDESVECEGRSCKKKKKKKKK